MHREFVINTVIQTYNYIFIIEFLFVFMLWPSNSNLGLQQCWLFLFHFITIFLHNYHVYCCTFNGITPHHKPWKTSGEKTYRPCHLTTKKKKEKKKKRDYWFFIPGSTWIRFHFLLFLSISSLIWRLKSKLEENVSGQWYHGTTKYNGFSAK